jgi:phospholipid/cholesterol/gamma-HCH transport system substrate-binding protein
MADRRLKLRVGVFVAIALAALSGLVVLFGGAPSLFTNRAEYTLLFPEAPGVGIGTPVRKSGVRIGEVTSLDLDESTGQVRVGIHVERKYPPRTGEEPVITRGLLSGDTSLDFVPKLDANNTPIPRGEPYPPGSEIAGVAPINTRALISRATDVIPTAQESLVRLQQSVQRFETAAPKIELAATEFAALSRSTRELIPELRQTNERVQDLLGAADQQPQKPDDRVTVRDILKEIAALLRTIRPVADDVQKLVRDNGPQLNQTLKSLQQASDSANDLLNPDNRKTATATLKNLQVASDDLTKTIRLVAILSESADKTLQSLNARLIQSEKTFENLNQITGPLAGNSEQITRDISETARNFNAASAQLGVTMTELRKVLGTAGQLLDDPALARNIAESIAGAARVIARLEKVAADLQVFADKVARRPETLGVGGAIRPGSGLKESPTAPLPPSSPIPLPGSAGPGPASPVTPIPPVPLGPGDLVPVFKPPVANTPPADRPPPRSGG